MIDQNDIIFTISDFDEFRDWLRLDMNALTWQGRHEKEFEDFWSLFFVNGPSLSNMVERFDYARFCTKIGPLVSWFNWLNERLLIYAFLYKDVSLYQLARQSNVSVTKLAGILRMFFIDKFPHLDDYLSSIFQVGNIACENLYLTFKDISKQVDIPSDIDGCAEDDVMPAMEVTLYDQWSVFLNKMKKELNHTDFSFKTISSSASLKKQLKFFLEMVILIIVGILLIYGVRSANKWYEERLVNRINVNEPQFSWLDKNLKFKIKKGQPIKKSEFKLENLDEIAKVEDKDIDFRHESEVILTSWDSLPRDFDVADLEQSEYEELRKGGYRDTRFGNKKAYRVMMNTVDGEKSRNMVNYLMNRYGVTQADNVRPGMLVPGGVYYNLYVPRPYLKEFLAQVMEIDESILYESRTRGRNPAGMNKVFIWIKII